MGVEIYPGFAAAELLFDENGAVRGVATGDMGVSKTGEKKDGWMPGMELHAKYTFLAEGVRGSLSKAAIAQYNLMPTVTFRSSALVSRNCGRLRRKIINPAMCSTHWAGRSTIRLAVALALSLRRQFRLNRFCNASELSKPPLSPYDEFQRFKMHPLFARRLRVASVFLRRRAITEGGYQSVPKLAFPVAR